MKITRTEKQVVNKKVVEKTICDLCGKQIHFPATSHFEENKIEFVSGREFGGSGGESETKFANDFCSMCVVKVIASLEELGVTFQTTESHW